MKLIRLFICLLVLAGTFHLKAQENTFDQLVFVTYNYLFANQGEKPDSVVYFSSEGDKEGKYEFQFDKNGKATSIILFYWDGFNWEFDLKEEITYNTQGEPQSVVYSVYSDSENAWKIRYQAAVKNFYDMDRGGRQYAFEYQIQGSAALTREMLNYNELGQVSSIWYMVKGSEEEDWSVIHYTFFDYDSNHRIIAYKYYTEDFGDVYGDKTFLALDGKGKIASEEVFNLLISDHNQWENERSGYSVYYYSSSAGTFNPVKSFEAKAWINGQILHVESETPIVSVALYNTAGVQVYLNTVHANTYSLPAGMNRGIYVVRLKGADGSVFTRKLYY